MIDADYIVRPTWLRDLVPAFCQPAHGRRAGSAGLPRRARERVQGHVPRGVPRLLPHRHGHAQRAQRDHPARHDDDRAARAARAHRLGRVVHHRGRRARVAHLRRRLRGDVRGPELRPWRDARHVPRLQEAALALGLRRDADHARTRRRAVPRPRHAVSRLGSVTTSSRAGCRGSPTASTCWSTAPRSRGRS